MSLNTSHPPAFVLRKPPETLDSLANEITEMLASGQVSGREMWEGVDLLQQYSEYLKDLSDNLPPCPSFEMGGVEIKTWEIQNEQA